MADLETMTLNNTSDRKASYRVIPKGFAPLEGDLPPQTYSHLTVPFAPLYQLAWNDGTVEGETTNPSAVVTFDGAKVVSTVPF